MRARAWLRAKRATIALVVILLVLAAGAGAIAGAVNVESTARSGQALQATEAALGANDIALKSLGQVVLLAEDRKLGVAGDDVVVAAAQEAEVALTELRRRSELAQEEVSAQAIAASLVVVEESAAATLASVSAYDPATASDLLLGPVKRAFENHRDNLVVERDRVAASLEDASSRAGWAGRLGAALVAFVIPGAVIVLVQLSARRQLRVAQLELDGKLAVEREAAKAKDEFIANISHELRTPLTSIYGFAELMLESRPAGNSDHELVALIHRESGELSRMVEDLLVAAQDTESAIAFDLVSANVAAEIEHVLEPLARQGFHTSVDAAEAVVVVDRVRFRQIVRNLVSNAHRHGGTDVSLTGAQRNGRYEVVVGDDGAGVPEEISERLFTRFIHEGSTPVTMGSVGLGLAVAKTLADGLGGSLEYRRTNGRTEFVLAVPLAGSVIQAGRPETLVSG